MGQRPREAGAGELSMPQESPTQARVRGRLLPLVAASEAVTLFMLEVMAALVPRIGIVGAGYDKAGSVWEKTTGLVSPSQPLAGGLEA